MFKIVQCIVLGSVQIAIKTMVPMGWWWDMGVLWGWGGVGRVFIIPTVWWRKLSFSLLVLPLRLFSLLPDGLLYMSWSEGRGGTNDLLSCSNCVLQSFPAGSGAVSIPHSYAAGQDALKGGTVKGALNGDWGSGSPQFAEEKEALLNFVGHWCGVGIPGEVLSNVCTQELGGSLRWRAGGWAHIPGGPRCSIW